MYDIIIGRGEADKQKYGKKGTILLGKHYVKMGQTTSLSSDIRLDIATSHVVFICGKRGSGKSNTIGVIAEGLSDLEPEIQQNLSLIILDTMGIYWTMKYPNRQEEHLLKGYGIEPHGLDVVIYTPEGYFHEYKKKGIPTDMPFSIQPRELSPTEWCSAFEINPHEPVGVFVSEIIYTLQDKDLNYSIDDIVAHIKTTKEAPTIKNAAINQFRNAQAWGLFSPKGTPLADLAKGGQITVLDVSCYATSSSGWTVKALAVAIIAQKLFVHRMLARKDEEFKSVKNALHYFSDNEENKQEDPLVWLLIDEAHEFLPRDKSVASSGPLITILREGRQPGISLVLATQQPGKIHTDVLTQADTVIAHRITAKIDTDALGMLMQSYMRAGLTEQLDALPRVTGAGIVFDDTNEKMFPMRVRPRFTWHGGSSPYAIPETKEYFSK
ncbi:MAG: energy-coupling factor transporter ATP-binding protein EcfA2 [Candidatus Woesearchaeota archaeon]|jgi:energy-coupling factor transporter ATP-binding protein EcfA2